MMSAHTPGPWAAKMDFANWNKFLIRPSTFGQQGRTYGYKPLAVVELDKRMTNASAEANARLIAAAPDLLEALHTARSVIVFQRDVVEGGKNAKSWSGPLEAIDAAITKAESGAA